MIIIIIGLTNVIKITKKDKTDRPLIYTNKNNWCFPAHILVSGFVVHSSFLSLEGVIASEICTRGSFNKRPLTARTKWRVEQTKATWQMTEIICEANRRSKKTSLKPARYFCFFFSLWILHCKLRCAHTCLPQFKLLMWRMCSRLKPKHTFL